ncbi:hypothetical protein BDV95DRAFT_501434 [Massariosphaeria phaeospora]|uniref:NAD(P)-binding domain-containing protein n=1 Tax=Massariosphaeria phaeospora TaxID=100035 RepID=A0A7C8M4F7_9PLEO|nr:hypothetical protein BDV95DRAFT_501434 [Massariosphaeria phaeospora]
MELKNIAILGARGTLGSAIVNELLKDSSRFTITGISREMSTYTAPAGSNIAVKSVDYSSLSSLTEAFAGQDAIINCITAGATQFEPMKIIVDAAVAAGVKFFFADEFVGNIEKEQFRRMPEAAVGSKLRVREYLKELSKEGKMQWTSLNGGPFFDLWLMQGPAGFDIPNKRARIYGTGLNKMCWTPLPTMALATANMLRNPGPVTNRPIHISTVANLTQSAILASLESVLDTKFSVENVDVAKIVKHSRIALERGEVAKAMKGLGVGGQFYEVDSGSDFSHLVENETVGVEVVSVEEAVRDALEKWGQDSPIVEGMFRIEACEI